MCVSGVGYRIFEAIKRAETIDGAAIRDSLAATNTAVGIGHITFDAKRNHIMSAVVFEIKDG